ncbi:MAG: hypothetical protein M1834_006500 [Cirrosporium novae-zelandiae]|nr:MAG: hypothetical protein M1834_006500 [Cirrosporium novae-zelandiae]
MASVISHQRQSGVPPPTSALPPLPKSRKSLPAPSVSKRIPSTSTLPSRLRTPSSALSKPPGSPRVGTSSSRRESMPAKQVRRAVSLAEFPQPPTPRCPSRIASPSPRLSSAAGSLSDKTKRGSLESVNSIASAKRAPRSIYSTANKNHNGARTSSLLNSGGDLKSVKNTPNSRNSDGFLSLPSPPQSRSSSAQGSYSTSATTFEDVEDGTRRGRAESDDATTIGDGRQSKSKENKGNVIVSVRVRPNVGGTDADAEGEWMVDGRSSVVSYRGKEAGDYSYDNVFAAHDGNAKVYDSCAKRLVRRVMEGYHGTVFAYGMTGTGKTFSMQGTATAPGVIPLAITDIFSYIRETPSREFLLRVSYLEIYNEKIFDLLSAPVTVGIGAGAQQQQEEIKIREEPNRGVYAYPLKEEIVQSPTQLLRVIARGDHARRTGSTQFNARSSRSHAVVQIVVESRQRATAPGSAQDNKRSAIVPGGVRVSTLSLIDLAGSERAAENKERRAEGAHINKSLLTLGTVIARLSGRKDKNGNPMDKDGKHLPYRDSKLTRLLQPALSGGSLVSILCTIQIGVAGSSASSTTHTSETLNTLKFASRAKNNIVSNAKQAEDRFTGGDAGSRALLDRYRQEIQTLRKQLESQQKSHEDKEEKDFERDTERDAEERREEQILEMQLARTALKERIEHLNRLILSSKSIGVNSSGSYSSLGMHPRLSSFMAEETGSRASVRSSLTPSILTPPSRSLSVSSAGTIGQPPPCPYPNPPIDGSDEDESGVGEFGDGLASLHAQNKALQADVMDKNRYIATLEKRLLHARRSSHSRTSMGFRSTSTASEDSSGYAAQLQEKDNEIASLREQLDDRDRMVAALRSAARKRDVAESTTNSTLTSPIEQKGPPNHQSNESNTSSILSGGAFSHSGPIGPFELLSPQARKERQRENQNRRKSVDEMSKMLDEMIQDRVQSGHLVKVSGGSLRVANDRKKDSLQGLSGVQALSPHIYPMSPPLPAVAHERSDSGVAVEAS